MDLSILPLVYAYREKLDDINLLEVPGRMLRISTQHLIGLVSEAAYVFRKLAIAMPESRIRAVPHRSVQRPARRSSRASSASASRRPEVASPSIRRSHASASNSVNHARSTASSISDGFLQSLRDETKRDFRGADFVYAKPIKDKENPWEFCLVVCFAVRGAMPGQ